MPKKTLSVSELEAQFQSVLEKIQQSADLLLEANELSEKFGFGSLGDRERSFHYPDGLDSEKQDDLHDESHDMTSPLIQAINEIGWRTSSLRC
jgi:hypothetical protein